MKKIETLRRIWSLSAPFHRSVFTVLSLLLVGQLLTTIAPLIFAKMVTAVTDNNTTMFAYAMTALLGLWLVKGAVSLVRERFEITRIDYALARHLSKISLKKFFEISLGQHHLGHSLIKRSVMSKGEAAVVGMVMVSIYQLIPTVFMVIFPTVFLLINAWQVGVCVLCTIVLFFMFTTWYNGRFIPRMRTLDTTWNTVSKKHGEVIQNADVVYVHAQEERVRRECDEALAGIGSIGVPMWLSYVNWFHGGQWFLSTAMAVGITVSWYLSHLGSIETGMFVALYMWISAALGTLTNISHLQRDIAKNIAPISKYIQFLNYEPDIVIPPNPVSIETLRGRIEFRNVSFTYQSRSASDGIDDGEPGSGAGDTNHDGEKIPAIRNISLTLEEGRRYAFVGRSGAGKSTLVGLLLRAYDPQSGHILIDGVDMRMLDYKELRRKIGLVPQEVSLFDGTVRYNVTFGLNGSADKVTDADLDKVAALARITEFSGKLEKGWDTLIGERGVKLSGGQKQRIGIARALIKDPSILIFDEATSSLDTENEARIRESIHEASVGKTTIIIAHRLATVKDADKIFVFDDGQVVGEGTHTELLQTNEFYRRLVANQVIMT